MKKYYLLFDKKTGNSIFNVALHTEDPEFFYSTEELWRFLEKHENVNEIKSMMTNPSIEGCIGFEIHEKNFEKKALNKCRYNPEVGGVEYRS